MNGFDPANLIAAGSVYFVGALAAAAFGDSDLVVNALAGGGLGAIGGQLMILWRARQGIRCRSAEIVAAWTALGAGFTLAIYGAAEVL